MPKRKRKKTGSHTPVLDVLGEALAGIGIFLFLFSVAAASHSADLTGDGKVDAADLAILKSQWRGTGIADLNHDGTVNARDAGILFSSWGTIPTGTRDPFLWPLHRDDPWNRPVGTGAALAPITNPRWLEMGRAWAPRRIYISLASADAPSRKVWRDNGTLHMTVNIDDNAPTPTMGEGDRPLVVVASDKLTFFVGVRTSRYSNWASYTGGSIPGADPNDIVLSPKKPGDYQAQKNIDIRGFGWKTLSDAITVWNRASRAIHPGGVIRKGELLTPYGIRHAVGFEPDQTALADPRYVIGAEAAHVWPAASHDGEHNMTPTGNVFYGSLLVLDPSLDLTGGLPTALGLETPQGLELARAVQDYGLYCTDTSYQNVEVKPTVIDVARDALPDIGAWGSSAWLAFHRDQAKIVLSPYLRVVTNNHAPNGGPPATAPIAGGSTGTLRRPLAPPFAP